MPVTPPPLDADHRWAQVASARNTAADHARSLSQTDDVSINGWIASIPIPEGGLALRDIEREALMLTMRMTGYNQSAAARILRISRPTLARKLREHGLKPHVR